MVNSLMVDRVMKSYESEEVGVKNRQKRLLEQRFGTT